MRRGSYLYSITREVKPSGYYLRLSNTLSRSEESSSFPSLEKPFAIKASVAEILYSASFEHNPPYSVIETFFILLSPS